ncbi:MAG: hypothetical protein ACERKZ_02630 [Lachnotalea sp.]
MSIQVISEKAETVAQKLLISKAEQLFVVEFAFKTSDKELTNKLIDELAVPNKNTDSIIAKYEAMLDEKPVWIGQIENLLIALEMYRIEEEKAINRLADILNAYGIDVTADEIRTVGTNDLKERVKREITL